MPLYNPPTPSGTVVMYAAATAPTGWLLLDGTAISRTTYATLFALFGTTYGVGDGTTTFNLPDARGVFIRGAGTQTISSINYVGTRGTTQVDAFQGHYHAITDPGHTHDIRNSQDNGNVRATTGGALSGWVYNNAGANNGTGNIYATGATTGITVTGAQTDGVNGSPRFGSETRPVNIVLTYIVKV